MVEVPGENPLTVIGKCRRGSRFMFLLLEARALRHHRTGGPQAQPPESITVLVGRLSYLDEKSGSSVELNQGRDRTVQRNGIVEVQAESEVDDMET